MLLSPTAYGQDDHANGASGATALTPGGGAVSGRIAPAGDYDVFRFGATAGADYVCETTVSGGMDTVLHLYDPRGQHVTVDDDGGQDYASRIAFSAAESGTYFLLVLHYDRQAGTGSYTIAVSGNAPTPAAPEASVATPPPSSGGGVSLSCSAFDPKLTGASLEISSQLPGSGSANTTVAIYRGSTRVATVASGSRQRGRSYQDDWDGRAANGEWVAPGDYTVRVSSGSARAEASLAVVRVGVRAVDFADDGRVNLAYHRADGRRGSIFPVDAAGAAWTLNLSALSAGCLDASNGRPLSGPAPWAELNGPPLTNSGSVRQRGRSLPVAYVVGRQAKVVVRLGESASSGGGELDCGYPIAGKPLRIVATVNGQATDASSEIRPGGQATLDLVSMPGGVGRYGLDVRFRFQVFDGSWQTLPGHQETQHLVYTVLGGATSQMLPGGTAWVAALDAVARWSGGQATDAEGVMDVCVSGVNSGYGLRYDVNSGAPAYTGGMDLHRPTLDLDAFLDDQDNGRVVNCLDCASLVTKFAAQAGVDGRVMIMGWGFRLNFLRGIGWQEFTNSLFFGSHAFSYHAWGSATGGATVHDACLSVDADSRPWSPPHSEGLPLGMPYSQYRDQLSPDQPRIQNAGRATVR